MPKRYCTDDNCNKILKSSQQKYCSRQHAINAIKGNKVPKRKSDQEYIDDVIRVKDKIGHYPTNAEYLIHGSFHPATLWKYFGAWANILDLAGYEKPKPQWSVNDLSPEDGGWLAGIIAGEGSFNIIPTSGSNKRRFSPVLAISQRDDNHIMIAEIVRLWKISKGTSRLLERGYEKSKNYHRKPTLNLQISDIPTLYYKVIPTFKKYPLRTKKHDEFIIFSKAVELLMNKRLENRLNLGYKDEEREKLIKYHKQIKLARKYYPPKEYDVHIINSYKIASH